MLRRALPAASRCLRGAASGAAPPACSRAFRNAVEFDAFSRARSVMPLGAHQPTVAVDAWVAPNATVVGNVAVDDRASVWYGAVLRGDLAHIKLGAYSSVGDRAVIGTARRVLVPRLRVMSPRGAQP